MKDEQQLGFSAVPVDDDIYNWCVSVLSALLCSASFARRVRMFNFDGNSRLSRDLRELKDKFGYDYIELEVEFAMDLYPYV